MIKFPLALLLSCLPAALLARTAPELPAHAVVISGELQSQVDPNLLDALRNALQGTPAKGIPQTTPSALERASGALLAELRDVDPSPAQRRWVESLLAHEPVNWRQHPETLTPWFIPVWDLAADARALLQYWEQREVLAQLLPQLESEPDWSPGLLGAAQDLQLLALQSLSETARQQLLSRPIPQGLGSPAWQHILQSRPGAGVWIQALVQAPDDALRRAMVAVWGIGAAEARAWLAQLRAARPALASSSVMALRADPDSALRVEALLTLLDEPRDYRAAAAALADEPALGDAALVNAFLAARGTQAQRGLALALRLRDSADTREFLASWLAGPDGDPSLKAALR